MLESDRRGESTIQFPGQPPRSEDLADRDFPRKKVPRDSGEPENHRLGPAFSVWMLTAMLLILSGAVAGILRARDLR